jgi:hypothetical protein
LAAAPEELQFAVGAHGDGVEVAAGAALFVVDVESDVALDERGAALGDVACNGGAGLGPGRAVGGLLPLELSVFASKKQQGEQHTSFNVPSACLTTITSCEPSL